MIGQILGPYRILEKLGEGGMGEVYKAKDTRLDRTVAIKVLPPEVREHPDRQARFEREAKAISQLTHPNICTLHDIGRDGETIFLVMEHLEGTTLATRLEKGPLPLDQALRIGVEIAGALEAAHRQGIIHRDLKPANVMLTKAGAKLLDFGLAKLRPGGPVAIEATSLPTKQISATAEGTLLGTVPYMAPEQLEGRDADARTDLWALGCVLYEMAAGRRAFEGKSHASVIGAIMTAEPPPLLVVQPLAPAALEHVVRTCLAKDPDERWQSAADVRRELGWIADQRRLTQTPTDGQLGTAAAEAALTRRRRVRHALGLVAAAAILIGVSVVITWLTTNRGAPAAEPLVFPIQLPGTVRLESGGSAPQNPGIVSPDGRRIAFVANGQLYVGSLGLVDARPLEGTTGAVFPFWTPDSRSIGYFARQTIWRVGASGGTPEELCSAPQGRGASWNQAGVLIAALDLRGPLSRIVSGREPTTFTTLDPSRKETSHRWPFFLPDGKHFLYFAVGEPSAVFVGSLDPNEARRLLIENAETGAIYAGGHVLFTQGNDLMAQPFDVERQELSRAPFRLVEGVSSDPRHIRSGFGIAGFSASNTGTLVYRSGSATSTLVLVDRASGLTTPIVEPGFYLDPALSPNGKRMAFAKRESATASDHVWILELAGNRSMSRFTSGGGENRAPLWTPDGRAIVFSSSQGGRTALFLRSAVGPGSREPLVESEQVRYAYSWAPDDTLLGWEVRPGDADEDVFALGLVGDRKPTTLIRTPYTDADPAVSPDRQWLVFTSTENGSYDLYVTRYPSLNGKWQIMPNGVDPRWSASGKELFYVDYQSGALWCVEIDMGVAPPVVGTPKLIHRGYAKWSSVHSFDVMPGEKSFVVNIQDAGPITVLLNWPSLLRR